MFSVSNGLNMQIFNLKVQLAYIFSIIQMSRIAHVVFPPIQSNSPPISPPPRGGSIPPHMKNPRETPDSVIYPWPALMVREDSLNLPSTARPITIMSSRMSPLSLKS